MKFTIILLVFAAAFLSECKKSSGEPANSNSTDSTAVFSDEKEDGDLQISFSARKMEKGIRNGINYTSDYLSIEYEIKNKGEKDFVVFNRGHFGFDDGKNAVYVEPQTNDIIEISQKAFTEPAGKRCPKRLIAIVPQSSVLKSAQSLKEELSLELPPKLRAPFADCEPAPLMPAEIKQAQFCIGAAEILDRAKVKVNKDGTVQGRDGLGEQQFLCSKMIKLK